MVLRPTREHATDNQQTYFVGSATWERRSLFHVERWAELWVDTLQHYRGKGYLLHEFVVMPDHFHALITPLVSLERAVQYIKGGFSYRAKKELGSNMEVWQKGFPDHRIRDAEDYDKHQHYVWLNPVKAGLCARPQDYRYGSASGRWQLDPIPQRLKPLSLTAACGAAEATPFQSTSNWVSGAEEGAPFQNKASVESENKTSVEREDEK